MKILFLVESTENETAFNLIDAAKNTGYEFDIIPYFQDGLDQCSIVIKNGHKAISFKNRIYEPMNYDGALLWCWGTALRGRQYLRIFEDQGVPVLNSTYDTEVTDSKTQSTRMLQKANIPVPRTIYFECADFISRTKGEIAKRLGPPPYVFKTDYSTQGLGIFFASSEKELKELAKELQREKPDDCSFIVQEFIGDSKKNISHFRVFVIGDYVISSAMKVTALQPMNTSNVSSGGSVEFVPICPQLKQLSFLAVKASGLNVAGVDIMTYDDNGQQNAVVLEINDGPGTKTFDKQGFKVSESVVNFFIDTVIFSPVLLQKKA